MKKTALVLACDDKFIAYASLVARRVVRLALENFPIVIVSDGVTVENKRLAQQVCPQISFIEAAHLFGDREFYTRGPFTRATYMRLFLDEILADFDRAVYIDSDMMPLVDPSPLIAMVPTKAPVMATYDMVQHRDYAPYERLPLKREAGYLQGGLQIFDLHAVRQERVFKTAIQFVMEHPEKCLLVDQDALNVALQGRWHVIDWRWNVLHVYKEHFPKPHYIRHLSGAKPWSPDKHDAEPWVVEEWRKELLESPWPEKYQDEQRRPVSLSRRFLRPITHPVEVRIKAARRGDYEAALYGEKPLRDERRFLRRLPTLLKQAEQLARDGSLAKAL